jgi:hypothetical protein
MHEAPMKRFVLPIAVGLLILFGLSTVAFSLREDAVVVARFLSPELERGAPPGWILDRKAGTPVIRFERDGDAYALNLVSDRHSAFGISRPLRVNVREYPYLNWRWKVDRLPKGGDIRKAGTNDQASQLYVAFTPVGLQARLNAPVVGYIWDNEAPKGLSVQSPYRLLGKVRYIVLRNKTDELGRWHMEKRNVYEDYKRLFREIKGGEPQGTTQGVQIYINSQNTRSEAETALGEIYFSKR